MPPIGGNRPEASHPEELLQMHKHNTPRPSAVPVRSGIVMLSGYGIKVSVDRRHLSVSDGVGNQRRTGRFAKATSRIKRLIVMAQTGFVTLDALRWLHDAKAAFIQLDHGATILTSSNGGLDDARLRRAQALLPNTEHRLAIACGLLEAKLKGQLAVLDSFGLSGSGAVRAALALLHRADRINHALIAEAKGAEAYWDAWAAVPMEFARGDRVPDYWRSFGTRRSPLTLAPRNAANPLNAILNYLYALLEIETRVALIARGLDTGLGLFHADEANRHSLAADCMEPVRPHVDAFVLNLARTRTFSAKDFAETRDGACRLSSTLAQELAPMMATWAKLIAPYAEGLGRHVARLAKSGLGIAAPIGPKGSVDRARVKVQVRRSPRRLRRRPRVRCRSAQRPMLAAVVAQRLRFASASTATTASPNKWPRRYERLCRSSGLPAKQKWPHCAPPAMIPARLPMHSGAGQRPLRKSAAPSWHGATTDRWTALISGATYCHDYNSARPYDRRSDGLHRIARFESAVWATHPA